MKFERKSSRQMKTKNFAKIIFLTNVTNNKTIKVSSRFIFMSFDIRWQTTGRKVG